MARKKQSPDYMPSQVTSAYWIYVERKTGSYPEATDRSGKWLIFLPIEKIDDVWERIKEATEEGRLCDSAQVATAKPNPNAADQTKKVICVYSYNWQDKKDVMRIRSELRSLGTSFFVSPAVHPIGHIPFGPLNFRLGYLIRLFQESMSEHDSFAMREIKKPVLMVGNGNSNFLISGKKC